MQLLSASVVNGILTPKVLMLIQINQKLLNDYIVTKDPKAYSMSIEDVLNALSGLLSGVIKEIIDSIQKELLRIILARLNEIMSYYMKELALEYAKKWIYLLKILISALKKNTSAADMKTSDGNGVVSDAINRVLSQVDYADIDSLVDEIIPNTKTAEDEHKSDNRIHKFNVQGIERENNEGGANACHAASCRGNVTARTFSNAFTFKHMQET